MKNYISIVNEYQQKNRHLGEVEYTLIDERSNSKYNSRYFYTRITFNKISIICSGLSKQSSKIECARRMAIKLNLIKSSRKREKKELKEDLKEDLRENLKKDLKEELEYDSELYSSESDCEDLEEKDLEKRNPDIEDASALIRSSRRRAIKLSELNDKSIHHESSADDSSDNPSGGYSHEQDYENSPKEYFLVVNDEDFKLGHRSGILLVNLVNVKTKQIRKTNIRICD